MYRPTQDFVKCGPPWSNRSINYFTLCFHTTMTLSPSMRTKLFSSILVYSQIPIIELFDTVCQFHLVAPTQGMEP